MKTKIFFLLLLIFSIFFFSMQLCTVFFGEKPIVKITSPLNNTNVDTNYLIISGTISDADNDQIKVKVSIQNTSIEASNTDVTDGTFSVNLVISALYFGQQYTIIAIGYDKNNNKSESVYISFTYIYNSSNSNPIILINSPSNNSNITATSLTVSGTINDADNDQNKVKVYIQNTNIEAWDNDVTDGTFSVDLDISSLSAEQSYTLIAIGYDIKNNQSDYVNINFWYLAKNKYIAGYYQNGNNNVACYWLNGVKTDLTDGSSDAKATSIFVSGSNVYIAGKNGNDACYWKIDSNNNIIITNLTNGNSNAKAESIYVSDSNVYVAGYYYDGSRFVACYWKIDSNNNITPTTLYSGTYNAWANSIYVSSSIYIAGYYQNSSYNVACYWDDSGNKTDLTDGSFSSYAYSIYVVENKIVPGPDYYITGSYDNGSYLVACYWRNQTRIDLPVGGLLSFTYSMFLSGIIVYNAGHFLSAGTEVACYWIDGIKYNLSDGTFNASANSIYVSGSSIYVAGYYDNNIVSHRVACYWINGIKYDLPSEDSTVAYATSIFVLD